MKDISTPVPPSEVRAVIKKSLENAALVNYERLSEEARLAKVAKLYEVADSEQSSGSASSSRPNAGAGSGPHDKVVPQVPESGNP